MYLRGNLMHRIKTNGASWDSIFLSIVKIITTINTIIETKILSVGFNLTDYGTYSQIAVIISIANSLLMLGLGDALNYYYNNSSKNMDEDKRLTFVNTIFSIELIAGFLVAFILVAGGNFLALYYSNPAITSLIVFVALRPMLTNLLTLYQILYVSVGRAKVIAVRNLLISLTSIITLTISVYLFHSIKAMYICTLIVSIIQLFFLALLFSKKEFAVNPLKSNFKYAKTIILYAIPMGLFALTNTLVRETDRLVIGFFTNTETVAIYSNCSKILPYDFIVTSFATVLIPYIMKYITSSDSRSVLIYKNYLKIGYYSVVVFAVGTIIVADQIIPFLYSSDYIAGKSVFIIYVFDSMLKFASMHLVLAANGNTKTILKYSVFSLIANLILNIILYSLLGIIGPAISTLLVTLGYTIAILYKTKTLLKAKWNDIFDFKEVCVFVVILVVSSCFFFVVNIALRSFGMNDYLNMAITLVLFGLTNLLFNLKRIKNALSSINSLKLREIKE